MTMIDATALTLSFAPVWPARGAAHVALDAVNLTVREGEVFGLVGESGSGKSTLARVILRLLRPGAGQLRVAGADPFALHGRALRHWRREVQMVAQDSVAALDPRRRIGEALREGLDIHRIGSPAARAGAVLDLLDRVGLDSALAMRRPHQVSGGQRQRVAIARALALSPRLLVADEAVSALDLSVQADILRLLQHEAQRTGMTMVFISHDLGVVRRIADRVMVLRHGQVMECGPTRTVFDAPQNAYTRELLASTLEVDFTALQARRIALAGESQNRAAGRVGRMTDVEAF